MRLRRPKPCPTPGPSFTWRTSRRKPAFVTGTNDQTPKSWNWVRKAEFSRFSCYDSLMHLYCRVQMSLLVVHTSTSCTVKNAHGVNIESLWSNLKVPYSTHLLFASQTQKVVSCIILTPTLLTSTAASSLGRWSPFFYLTLSVGQILWPAYQLKHTRSLHSLQPWAEMGVGK